MNCKVCSSGSREIFSENILRKYTVKYYHCPNCDYLQTEEPFWLDEAYQSAIGVTDTGILIRNRLFAKRSAAIISTFYNCDAKFLDFAGGYGIFVRMMRDLGFNFQWYDPYAENIFAKGFEYNKQDNILLVTAFECFEHFTKPLDEIQKIIDISENIIFSTRLFHGVPPKPNEWWYYSLDSGQHISFYSTRTLKFLAKKFNLYLNTDGKAFHMLSKERRNPFLFNTIIRVSDLGLSKLFYLQKRSLMNHDNEFLSGREL